MSEKEANRIGDLSAYTKLKSLDGLWQVCDIATGEVVALDGMMLSGLEEREADQALDILETGKMKFDQPINSPAGSAGA